MTYKTNVSKIVSLILAVILCTAMLAGCKDEDGEENTKSGPLYTAPEIAADEADSIDTLNDAVTVAILENINENYSEIEGYYNCESHAVISDTYSEGCDSFDALVLRSSTNIFDPVTGDYDYYPEDNSVCLISFAKNDGGYTAAEYHEDTAEGPTDVLEKGTDMFDLADLDSDKLTEYESELTPYRYIKDGEIYLLNTNRYAEYADSLVEEILTSDTRHESYSSYITENSEAYEKLLDIYLLDNYLISEFLKGDNNTPKGYVMYRALRDKLEESEESIDVKLTNQNNAQSYFNELLELAKSMRAEDGYYVTSFHYPIWSNVIKLYDETLTDEELLEEKYIYDIPDSIVVHKGGDSVTYTKEDGKYYEIFRRNQRWYVPVEDLTKHETNADLAKSVSEYYEGNVIITDAYIEYVYSDGTPGNIFAGAGNMVFVPADDSSGKYDVYRSTINDGTLSDILESCFE